MSALRKSFLSGTALAVLIVASSAAYAADVAAPAAEPMALPSTESALDHLIAEFGGQVFITKPGAGVINNSAKFNQYGDRTAPVFLTMFNIGATVGGDFKVDMYGKNVGTNAQAYEIDVSQAGQQYFSYDWVSTPNLRSNSAETIFGGVGSNYLTVPIPLITALNTLGGSPGAAYPGTGTTATANPAAAAGTITKVVNAIAPYERRIDLGIQHDRQDASYKWTPTENWTMGVDYSHDHRYGTQEQGLLFSSSTSTPLAAAPMPVNDTTDNASIFAEYHGISPWGMKWNGLIKYDLSIYKDSFSQYTAQNPFGGPNSPDAAAQVCPGNTAILSSCYGLASQSTMPDNGSNSIMGQVGVDLPGFKSNRYMGTFQFTDMRQNSQFLPMSINPTLQATNGALPRNSLDGSIDTTLLNNVLTTRINSEWQNKITYRYYDDQNNTPAFKLLTPWIINDSGIAGSGTAVSGYKGNADYAWNPLVSSYTKQNASDQINWTPNTWVGLGFNSAWEHEDYRNYAVNYTNEWTEKLFGHVDPADWLSLRATAAVSWRRYGEYNWAALVSPALRGTATDNSENANLAAFNISNRDRTIGNFYADIKPFDNLTITPTANVRWDTYPGSTALIAAGGAASTVQGGLTYDHDWAAGVEVNYAFNSSLTFMGSYMNERDLMQMASGTTASNTYIGAIDETVQTITAAINYQIIPDVLSLKLSASMMFADDRWGTQCKNTALAPSYNSSCGVYGGTKGTATYNPGYAPELTKYDRLDAVLAYKVDASLLNQLGLKDGVLKLHWALESNHVTDWQLDSATLYAYSSLTTSTSGQNLYALYMGGNNPNYRAQFISASAVVKW